MKAHIFLILIALTLRLSAQNVSIGVHGGPYRNSYAYTSDPNFRGGNSFTVGVLSEFYINDKLFFDASLNLSTMNVAFQNIFYGYAVDGDPLLTSEWEQVKRAYIDIPVSVNYVFGRSQKKSWYVGGGLTNAVMMNGKSNDDVSPLGLGKYILFTHLKMGLSVRLPANFIVGIEPMARIAMLRTTSVVQKMPVPVGLSLRVLKSLGK